MTKKDYAGLAANILMLVGGAENISFCEHCMTRLRFNVKDRSLVRDEELNELDGTNGRLWVGEQLQIIIGTAVNGVYDEVCKQGNFIASDAINENLDVPKKKKNIKDVFKNILTTMTECIVPCLGAFIAMGMFAAITSIIGPTCLNLVSTKSSIYNYLTIAQNAITFFVPVLIAYTSSKKFGCSPIFALVLICIQLSSDWMTGVSEGTLNIFGAAPMAITLNTQIIPIIIEIWLLSKIEKILNRFIPDMFKFVFVGILELLICLPICLYVITPLGTSLGYVIASPIQMLESVSPVLVAFIVSGLYELFVAFGLHQALGAIFVMDLFTAGVNYSLLPAQFASQFLIVAVTDLAISFKSKNKKTKLTCSACAISAIVGGVMEPSIFGIYMKNFKLMLAPCLGMAIAGGIHRMLNVGVYALSSSNFIGWTALLSGGVNNLVRSFPGTIVGCIVAFVVTFILYGEKNLENS